MGEAYGEKDHAAALSRANALLEQNRPQDALRHYDAAIRAAPGLAEAHYGKALCMISAGADGGALRCLDEAIRWIRGMRRRTTPRERV